MRTSLCPYELKNNSNADIVLQWVSPPPGILASRISVTGVSLASTGLIMCTLGGSRCCLFQVLEFVVLTWDTRVEF